MALAQGIQIANCTKEGTTLFVYIEDGRGVKRGDTVGPKPFCALSSKRSIEHEGLHGTFISPIIDRETLSISCTAECNFRTDSR